jgi:hypothetical protein
VEPPAPFVVCAGKPASFFQHFALYNRQGGAAPFNRVNVASLKILALSA